MAQWEVELTARDIYDRAVRAGTLPGDPSGLGPDDGSADFSARVVAAGADGWEDVIAVLKRDEHVAYLRKSLGRLSAGHVVLDASRCWLCYWIVHALALLDAPDPGTARDVVSFLALCQHPDGGFGGGPGQMPHLAPTYAAVACLAEIATGCLRVRRPRLDARLPPSMPRRPRRRLPHARRRRDGRARVLRRDGGRAPPRPRGRGGHPGHPRVRRAVSDARGRAGRRARARRPTADTPSAASPRSPYSAARTRSTSRSSRTGL